MALRRVECRVVLAAAVLAVLTSVPITRPVDAVPAPVFGTYGPAYMGRDLTVTKEDAIADAIRFNPIIARYRTYARHVPAMRQAKPSLQLIAYMNGTFADSDEVTTFPEAWYLKTADGTKVRHNLYGSYLMNPADPGWTRRIVDLCNSRLAFSGYDGCLLDNLGATPVLPPFGPTGYVDGQPIDPRTGAPWTAASWLEATTAMAGSVRQAITPRPLFGNNVGAGIRYFDPVAPSAVLFEGTDAMMTEGFIRGGRDPLANRPTLETWRSSIDMVTDSEARGRRLLVTTKVWNTGTIEEKEAWHRFALSSYLLAAGGLSRFVFLYDLMGNPVDSHPYWDQADRLGGPRSAFFLNTKGIYQRNFTSGRVLVNPSDAPMRMGLAARFTTLDGTTVNSIELPPYSGEVLLKTT